MTRARARVSEDAALRRASAAVALRGRRWRGAVIVAGLLLGAACGPPPPPTSPRPSAAARVAPGIDFVFVDVSGTAVSSASTRGRALCVLFVTTYDLASQVAAHRLDEVVAAYAQRSSGLLVVLEAGSYAPLAAAFRDSLALTLPVAMADESTLAGGGPFGNIDRVPTLVVLDADGREVARRMGVPTHQEIEAALLPALGPDANAGR